MRLPTFIRRVYCTLGGLGLYFLTSGVGGESGWRKQNNFKLIYTMSLHQRHQEASKSQQMVKKHFQEAAGTGVPGCESWGVR